MAFKERISIIQRIQELRGSTVFCYLTSLRQNVPGVIAEDAVRIFFDHLLLLPKRPHLLLLPKRPIEKLDVYLCSNGGSGTVPWRLVSLFREFAKSFCVLVPYRAYSAASLLALGADEIVMHPFAELGPIDPTVSNDFNPTEEGTHRKLGISVEDLSSYVSFIKSTVGITHEDELIKAIEILANKIHPLSIGNVERFLQQSRMIAKKMLRTHMKDSDEHMINEIVENMASKLFYHGHPINRREAKEDLRLKNVVGDLTPELETCLWDLYKDFELEFKNMDVFNPASDLAQMANPQPGLGAQPSQIKEYELLHAIIESERLSSKHSTKRRYTAQMIQPTQQAIREDILSQEWSHSEPPTAETQPQP